jgi:V-type H+-transporting ATPase subunit H
MELFLKLLEKLSRVDTLQNILTLLDSLLFQEEERISWLFQLSASKQDPLLPFAALLKYH